MPESVTARTLYSTRLSLAAVERQADRVHEADVRYLLRTLDRAACRLAAGDHADAYAMHRTVVMGMACLH